MKEFFRGKLRPNVEIEEAANFLRHYQNGQPLKTLESFQTVGRGIGQYGNFQGQYGRILTVPPLATASAYAWFASNPQSFQWGLTGVAMGNLGLLHP